LTYGTLRKHENRRCSRFCSGERLQDQQALVPGGINNQQAFKNCVERCLKSHPCQLQFALHQLGSTFRYRPLDLCRGSVEVGNPQKCKCQKQRWMPRFFRNTKVPTGAEELSGLKSEFACRDLLNQTGSKSLAVSYDSSSTLLLDFGRISTGKSAHRQLSARCFILGGDCSELARSHNPHDLIDASLGGIVRSSTRTLRCRSTAPIGQVQTSHRDFCISSGFGACRRG
jgi:hypothetical protein